MVPAGADRYGRGRETGGNEGESECEGAREGREAWRSREAGEAEKRRSELPGGSIGPRWTPVCPPL